MSSPSLLSIEDRLEGLKSFFAAQQFAQLASAGQSSSTPKRPPPPQPSEPAGDTKRSKQEPVFERRYKEAAATNQRLKMELAEAKQDLDIERRNSARLKREVAELRTMLRRMRSSVPSAASKGPD